MKQLKDQKVKVSQEVLSQAVSGETVLLDLAGEQYFGLDKTASRIWELIVQTESVQDVFEIMLEEYDVDPEQLGSDIEQMIESLFDKGLIEKS